MNPRQEPTTIAALQAEYAAALARNADAKARLRRALVKVDGSEVQSTRSLRRNGGETARGKLDARLAVLRTRRQGVGYDALSRAYEGLEEVARAEGVYDGGSGGKRSGRGVGDELGKGKVDRARRRVDELMREVDGRIERLEMALVKAWGEVRRERERLEKVRDGAEGGDRDSGAGAGGEGKLRALERAREELQAWIEECLARCERPVADSRNGAEEEDEEPGKDAEDRDGDVTMTGKEQRWTGEDVDREYERYIETRKRLLRAVEGLRTPMAMTSPVKIGVSPEKRFRQLAGASVGHQRHGSVQHRDDRHGVSLQDIETKILPQHNLHQALSTHLTHLQQRSMTHNARLLQVLNLLSHESHLLPAYPLRSTAENSKISKDGSLDQSQIAVAELLDAWAFASSAADQSLHEIVTKHIETGNIALDDAQERVDQMRIMNAMKKEVQTLVK